MRATFGTRNKYSIIFVHGLGSNPDTTWRARRSDATLNTPEQPISENDSFVNWISDFLPNDLRKTKLDTRLLFYNFDSYWKRDAVHTRLSTLGADMLEHINDNIRRSENVGTKYLLHLGVSLMARLGTEPRYYIRGL